MTAAPAGVTVEVTADIEHRCPFVDERDIGTITVSWVCGGGTVELHGLADYLRSWRDVTISHEELASTISAWVGSQPGIAVASVAAKFTTAGMTVKATA